MEETKNYDECTHEESKGYEPGDGGQDRGYKEDREQVMNVRAEARERKAEAKAAKKRGQDGEDEDTCLFCRAVLPYEGRGIIQCVSSQRSSVSIV